MGRTFSHAGATLHLGDCVSWLERARRRSIHGVITDPPFGAEYNSVELRKLRGGRGGLWRQPVQIGGSARRPLPRFTTLTTVERERLQQFFARWAAALCPVLVPGAHVFVACSPLFEHVIARAMEEGGFERRGVIVRLVRTLRGGDRPKGAEGEFPMASAMPRSCWEPWGLYRKPLEGTVADCLRRYGTGALRRTSGQSPFADVIESERTPAAERALAAHPSLKPQRFLRTLVRAALPCNEGVILDPFAGSGSTLAACVALRVRSIGVERDPRYFAVARRAVPRLSCL